jgi:protease-4
MVSFLLTAPAWSVEEPKDAKPDAKPKVAVFRLMGDLTESPVDETLSLGGAASISLNDLVARMQKAGDDPDVKALVILHEAGSIGSAQAEELRQTMAKVRAGGKPIYANADSLGMSEYVLLSGATRLSVVPTADLSVTGLYGESPYLRGLLDRIGVRPDFLTCGPYKSAAEIFLRDGPSPEAEAMQNWLLDGRFDTTLALISRGRDVEVAQVRKWIDAGPYTAEKAQAAGLIDAVEHRQELEAWLKSRFGPDVVFDKKYGEKTTPKLDFSSPLALFKFWGEMLGQTAKKPAAKGSVGIVYVDGPITLGGGQPSLFDMTQARSSHIRKALDEAARDESIRAVVLRVNSPGGSAVASEIILDATWRVKAKKPFVVSMGDVAGSGGYYVACASDLIFADESTITASIGVISGKLATTTMWNKVGVTFRSYKRGENAGMLASQAGFTQEERARMEALMNEIYNVFKGHVRAIRGDRLKKPLDELAGGRVFTGRQALELGLVDRIGTLRDAIHHVAAQANLTDYDVRVVPAPKNFLEQLVEDSSGNKDTGPGIIGPDVPPPFASCTASLLELAMPYLQHLDAHRVAMVRMALQRLQLIQQEGVVLMMPEMAMPR